MEYPRKKHVSANTTRNNLFVGPVNLPEFANSKFPGEKIIFPVNLYHPLPSCSDVTFPIKLEKNT